MAESPAVYFNSCLTSCGENRERAELGWHTPNLRSQPSGVLGSSAGHIEAAWDGAGRRPR